MPKAGLDWGFKRRNVVLGVDLQAVRVVLDIYVWILKTTPTSTFPAAP
jgi:hypothetical protein